MEKERGINKAFYKALGRLIYAMTLSDGKIRKQEIQQLNDFVSEKMAPEETVYDDSGMNHAFYVDFEFEKCMEENMDAEEAKKSFLQFIDVNMMHLRSDMIERSLQAIEAVAEAYKKTNKKEKAFLSSVRAELDHMLDLF